MSGISNSVETVGTEWEDRWNPTQSMGGSVLGVCAVNDDRKKAVESYIALIIVIYGIQSCVSRWLVRARCYDRKTPSPLMRKPLLIRTIVLFLFLDRNLAVDILCDSPDMMRMQ